ncbi:MAG TPA: SprT family zinc-dependent metalloprotease [Casimicrobiaceae bacterium]|nr:SprT family zinc-dependent metalloprotease [Casimicrobiaceae bacterium]
MTTKNLDRVPVGSARSIRLESVDVNYRLIRARRRTIGMEIDLHGLTVRVPRWVTITEVEAALFERAKWIRRTLDAWRGRRREGLPREWKTGASIVVAGRDLSLAVYPSRKSEVRADLFDLTVLHPRAAESTHVAEAVRAWLKHEALRLLTPRVAHFSARLARPAPPIVISNARSEWGSCNHKGEIRLNWRLAQLPPPLADYVVAHEIAHLAELNHSRRFWNVVEALLPGHAARRRALDEWTALLAT